MGETNLFSKVGQDALGVNEVHIIPRNSIPFIESVMVEGKLYNLGQLYDFHKNPILSRFVPEHARLSMSWVKLKKEQVLECHQHPTSSLIIVCEGEGEVMGERQQKIYSGDMVVVPPNHSHGFIGKGIEGFWALSIQFEGSGLYENPNSPRVEFMDKDSTSNQDVKRILTEQTRLEKVFNKNSLMVLARSAKLKDPKIKERLLEALNCWSDWFQKILAARLAMEHTRQYFDAAEQHLQEEIGHNKLLFDMRHNKNSSYWDPLLDSAASWFHHQVISASDEEKTILMHLVLEGASTQFHTAAKTFVPEAGFFDLHSTLDEDHFGMGVRLLEQSKNLDVPHLITVLQHGWSVFGIIATQMAHYALGKSVRPMVVKGKETGN